VAISFDGKYVASGGFDNTIKIWDLTKKECISKVHNHDNFINFLQFSRDGRKLFSSDDDSYLLISETVSGDKIKILPVHD